MKKPSPPWTTLLVVCALLCALLALTLAKTGLPEQPERSPDASAATTQVRTSPDAFTLYCPSIGKADAFLLRSDEGAVLIDTGEDADDVLELLERCQVTRLDALILSHFDHDHIGGAAEVLGTVEVETLYRSAFSEDSLAYELLMDALEEVDTKVVTVTDTLSVTAAGARLTLYPPLSDSYEKHEDNNASLLTAVEAGGVPMLFTGDALKPRIREFLEEQYDGTRYQFLKIPHHGLETRPTALLLEAFTPRWALITSSPELPELGELTEELERAGVECLLTRRGDVTLTCSDGSMERAQ